MILPIEQLDQVYIVPHIEKRSDNKIRVLSLETSSVTFKTTKNRAVVQIAERDFSDFIHNMMSYINATNDISVMIYPHEIGNGEGSLGVRKCKRRRIWISSWNKV